ncbi:hypothetical protein CANINC_000267 [Pichia inconspicua]|uniref:Leucine-rich repeat-containing protein n=1 Tax=Pichia inconspicua TaxID=52247 RepID=A0A4T0X6Q4_9ASCO|nr:hypothetical protein CANINC_000267 [[Candida] inconspicua]
MAKTTCDGDIYIHNLSTFIQSHERQLANALVAYRKLNSKELSKNSQQSTTQPSLTTPTTSSTSTSAQTELPSSTSDSILDHSNTPNDTTANYDEENIKEISKPVRLSLSLHHLYFILGKFKDLGINVGPMNLRLDNLDSDNTSNYVSFLSEFQRNKKIDSDSQSIHSISSVKSVMSSVSALWNTFGSSSKIDNSVSDLKYLYSAFSKLPCLRLANEPNAKLIDGHEEYPFETATPVVVFKNILVLEISDLDPKEIYGWHLLATKLRYLVVKKANITDPLELLVTLVDADQRVRGESEIFVDGEVFDDDNHLPNSLSKTKSNDSESDSFKTPHSISNMPMSHSALNLSSSLNNKISPNIISSHSFASSYNQHSLNNYHSMNYPHNYNYHYYHHQHSNNNGISNNQLQPQQIQQQPVGLEHSNNNNSSSFSTSPNASPLYYSNRLYPQEDMTYGSSTQSAIPSHSTRRSYYYNPQGKLPRRSRGSSHIHSSSLTIKSTGGESISSNDSSTKNFKRLDGHSRNSSLDGNEKKKSDLVKQNDYWKLLKHLSLTENKISKISLQSFDKLSNLTSLDLSHNKLTTLPAEPISKLINLKSLNLSHNKLTSIEKLPKSLTRLTVLNLRSNKLSQLDSIENLSNLQKIDLRRNSITKLTDLKPLLQLNANKVKLQAINLYGNPITNVKGYRVELFNLFNGVDYSNNIKIDGSRPGIFESRMLLDEKTSRMKFKNYIDESIISKMTASVSNMNLSHILNNVNNGSSSSSQQNNNLPVNHDNLESNHPVLDQMSTSINRSNESSTTLNSNATAVTQSNIKSLHNSLSSAANPVVSTVSNNLSSTNKSENSSIRRVSQSPTIKSSLNLMTRSNSTANITEKRNSDKFSTHTETIIDASPPVIGCVISSSPSLQSPRNPVSISLRNSNDFTTTEFVAPVAKSSEQSQRASNDFSAASSILTAHTNTANGSNSNDTNPLSRLSLATPALPVITPATTTTMTTTNVSTPLDTGSLHANLTPKSVSSKIDYFTAPKNSREENKENFEDEYSNLKIGVV